VFEEPLRTLLHEFKYKKGLYLGPFIAQLMMQKIPLMDLEKTCLIPVPIHPQRLKERGYNQAVVLTQLLAKKLGYTYDLSRCQKKRNTPPQAGLDKKARQKNLRHAFETKPIHYPHVVLIDDLMTTGSTANELACTLKAVGVHQVDVWCCARTV
jgi:ComF family protein